MTQDYIPFPEVVAEIERLSARRATGTMFIATKANRSAQLMLNRGKIVFIYFFNKRGEEALELMSTIQAGRFRFQEGTVSRRMDLPPTDAILKALGSGQQMVVENSGQQQSSATLLSQEQKTTLETCLAGFIGPMAGIVCEDHLQSAADLEQAINALAEEIPSSVQAQKFRAMVKAQLG